MGEDGWLKNLLCVPSLPTSGHFRIGIRPWPSIKAVGEDGWLKPSLCAFIAHFQPLQE